MVYLRHIDMAVVGTLFEDLCIVERAAYRDADPAAQVAFDRVVDLVRRASLSNDQHRVALARMLGLFDAYREPRPGDPERDR